MKNQFYITTIFLLSSLFSFGQSFSHEQKNIKINVYLAKFKKDSSVIATMSITNISNKKVIITANNPNHSRYVSNILLSMHLNYGLEELHRMDKMSIPIYYLNPGEKIIVSKIKSNVIKDLKRISILFNVLNISKFHKKKCTKNITRTNDLLKVDCFRKYVEQNGHSQFYYSYDLANLSN